MLGQFLSILLILIGIGFSYTIIFIILHFLHLFPSKSKRINQNYQECKDKIKCIRYTLKKVCERKYELMPMAFILFITLILSCMVICWDKSFNVSGPQIIVHMPFGLYTCAQELTTMSILVYISFWAVYKSRYISQYLCVMFCYYDNNELKGRGCWFFRRWCKAFYTLGSRLDIVSTTRNDSEEMREKAKITRTFGTFLIGFCTIFITLIFGFSEKLASINPYYLVLILGLQLIALVLLIIGVDSFDTCLNKFPENELTYVKEYYNRGIRLFYNSMQMILLSFLIIAFLINWILTVSMVYLFLLFGYTYWFPRLKCKDEKKLCEFCQEKKSGYLFSTDAQYYFNSRYVPYELKEKFEYEGYPLSRNPKLTKRNENEWEIFDDVHDEKFIIKKEDGTKKVYREMIKK